MANKITDTNALRGLRRLGSTIIQGVQQAAESPVNTMYTIADAMADSAKQQKQQQIDYATAQETDALRQTLAEAAETAQTAQAQNDIDAARALDSAALSAAARGDRGGIGQGQYEAIQAAALQNAAAIRNAQTKLAADTARQIAELRAKGEFEKADAILEVGQTYLKQLLQLEQWSANWDAAREKEKTALEHWEKSYELSRANVTGTLSDGTPTRASRNDEQQRRSAAASLLLKAGVVPDAQQLSALGMTSAQAQSYIQSLMLRGKL